MTTRNKKNMCRTHLERDGKTSQAYLRTMAHKEAFVALLTRLNSARQWIISVRLFGRMKEANELLNLPLMLSNLTLPITLHGTDAFLSTSLH